MLTREEVELLKSSDVTSVKVTSHDETEISLALQAFGNPVVIEAWLEDNTLCLDYGVPGLYEAKLSNKMDQAAQMTIEKIKAIIASREEYRLKLVTGSLTWKHCWCE